MIDVQERIDDLKELECEFGNQTFTWKSNSYICVPSSIKTILTPQPGAMDSDRVVKLLVRQELFASGIFPESQQQLVFRNQKWMILEVQADSLNVQLELNCIADNKGAHG